MPQLKPLPLSLLALAVAPSTVLAANGGAGFTGSSTAPVSRTGTASDQGTNGIALSARAGTLERSGVTFHGSVPQGQVGRDVLVQRQASSGWRTVARTTSSSSSGAFAARWRADRGGRWTFRAVVATPASSARVASPGGDPPRIRITVYRRARATWYSMNGRRTACGVKLTATTLGVAHRTLPCGTKVALLYRGRIISVPVIDRGPYAHGASLDLTRATADRLGFTSVGVGTVGALPSR